MRLKETLLAAAFFTQILILIMAAILSQTMLPNFIKGKISEQLSVSENSDLFEIWKNPPVHPHFSAKIFNYTNFKEWSNNHGDQKLRVEEVGPFVFKSEKF